jgi:RNA polymerase sigma factor (sigma-70 family)
VEGPNTTQLAGDALREPAGANARHAVLFERVAARIYRYFKKQVWDAGEAEELAQRTLVVLEESLRERSYDPARSFNAWMWLKAHTVFAQWCRDRATKGTEGLAEVSVPSRHEDPVDARMDAAATLREIQRRLGPEAYEIFVLYYVSGLTQSEVAESTGRDRKTVAARLREAHAVAERFLSRGEKT